MRDEQGEFLMHVPCPSCGSSDAGSLYTDGHFYCFSCGHYKADQEAPSTPTKRRTQGLLSGEYKALPARKLTEETCRRFDYTVGTDPKHGQVHIANYRSQAGEVVAQHLRTADKDFPWVKEPGTKVPDLQLFGRHLWGVGKKIVITEGEIDAMTVSQLQGHKWPVVGVGTGADGASKALKANLEWLCGFDEIVLMFDMDEPGRKAAEECATLFPPGKCKIATLPFKDPNECLKQNQGEAVISAIWQARPWRPDGIVKLSDIKDQINKPVEWGLPWFLPTLTKLTYGRRFGEVYAVGAGTGVGKTDFLTQQMAYDITDLGMKVAVFALEQQPAETGKRIAGKLAGRRFHVPDDGWTQDELDQTVDAMVEGDKLFLYDHFGSAEWDVIESRIRFLVVTEGVRIFYLDHLTALAAGQEDERKALEDIMARIGGLVKELDIILILVSHLATPEGKPHEEGGRVMIRHFKGSRAIGFWCHYMFGLERNQQADDEDERQTTTFRVLKDRYVGQATGQTISLGYDRDTGRLFEGASVVIDDGFDGAPF